jgi:hypothetical protein
VRRDLAVALLLSVSIHLIAAVFFGAKRPIETLSDEIRETEEVRFRPTSVSFEPPKRIEHRAAKAVAHRPPNPSVVDHSDTRRPLEVASPRAERPPALPAVSRSRAAPAAGATARTIEGKSPAGSVGKLDRSGTSEASAPSVAHTAAPSAEAAGEATAKLQQMLEGIAASAAPPTPFQATPDAAAIALEARSGYDALINPPPDVVSRAVAIISFKRTAGSPDSVVYILRHRSLLGISYCTGWSIVAHPLGGGPPQTGYVTGPCRGDAAALPAWADRLPPLPAHDAPPRL